MAYGLVKWRGKPLLADRHGGEEGAFFATDGTCLAGYGELRAGPDVTGIAAGVNLTGRLDDELAGAARVGEQTHRRRERDGLERAGVQVDLGEPDELLSGERDAGGGVVGVGCATSLRCRPGGGMVGIALLTCHLAVML